MRPTDSPEPLIQAYDALCASIDALYIAGTEGAEAIGAARAKRIIELRAFFKGLQPNPTQDDTEILGNDGSLKFRDLKVPAHNINEFFNNLDAATNSTKPLLIFQSSQLLSIFATFDMFLRQVYLGIYKSKPVLLRNLKFEISPWPIFKSSRIRMH
jgi:hypothetical protein